jgi:glycosyltransferase involved in cell wall biosynthesis
MIVKNEALVIERCLNSVKGLIDSWVIVDTGSNDGTQQLIQKCLKSIPGELHERPWVHFAHNRNEALSLAKEKGDYLLFIDADEILEFSPAFSLPNLDKDVYFIQMRQVEAADVKKESLINNHLQWEWKGVLHETLDSLEAKTSDILPGVINIYNKSKESGRARDPEKYLKDALTLEKALIDEPNNSRYVYYLGVSYSAAHQYGKAIAAFLKRSLMPSDDEQETYMAIYHVALMHEKMGNHEAALPYYFKAYDFRPTRAEPLFRAASIYRMKMQSFFLSYFLTKYALTLPYPENDACVEYWVYEYSLLTEHANASILTGRYHEAIQVCQQLLSRPHLPAFIREQLVRIYALSKSEIDLNEKGVASL